MKSVKYKKRIRNRILRISTVAVLMCCCLVLFFTLTSPDFRIAWKLKSAQKAMVEERYDDAIALYDEARIIIPTDPRGYDGLRRAYVTKGESIYDRDYELAMVCYECALDIMRQGIETTGDLSFSDRISEIESLRVLRCRHETGTYRDAKEPTCTEEGIREWICDRCGAVVYTMSIPKLPHELGDWEEEEAVDCVHDGIRIRRCTVCGELVDTETIPMLGHTPGEWETERESDCLPGLMVRRCERCGEVVESEEIPATMTHIRGNWEIVLEPECEKEGEKVRKCERCGSILETEVIPPNGHVKDKVGEAFEDTDVLLYRCTVCGIVLEPESLAHFIYMDSLPQTFDDDLFNDVSAGYDDKGKLVISFALNEPMEITDYGYMLYNESELPNGIVVSYDECRNKVRNLTILPRSLNEPVEYCSLTDTKNEIGLLLKSSTEYFYRVFYIKEEQIYISEFYRFETGTE